MKRFVLTLAILLAFNCANAQLFQQNEGRNSKGYDRGITPDDPENPDPPVTPVGSGLLLLTGLSLGYACFKRSRKEDD